MIHIHVRCVEVDYQFSKEMIITKKDCMSPKLCCTKVSSLCNKISKMIIVIASVGGECLEIEIITMLELVEELCKNSIGE